MAHVREGIRDAIVTAVTGLTTTGTNVELWRLHPVESDEVPGLSVMVGSSPEVVSDDVENQLGTLEVRDLPVTIETRVVQATSSSHAAVLDTLDDSCAEVETAMVGTAGIIALTDDVRLISTELSLDGSGERPVALAVMEWIVRYTVDRAGPSA